MDFMDDRGQASTVFKLLQGGVIAMVMLGIIFGIINTLRQQQPGSGLVSVSKELLSSAYSARGTGEAFTRKANLEDKYLTAEGLEKASGIGWEVFFFCDKRYCVKEEEDERKDCSFDDGCKNLRFKKGAQITVCAICEKQECQLFFGEKNCGKKEKE